MHQTFAGRPCLEPGNKPRNSAKKSPGLPGFREPLTPTSSFPSSYLQASGELRGPVTPAGRRVCDRRAGPARRLPWCPAGPVCGGGGGGGGALPDPVSVLLSSAPPDLQTPHPPAGLCSTPIFVPCFQSRWASGSLSLTSLSDSGASPHSTLSNTVWNVRRGPNPVS